ncbi:MAG: entericidin A/B family lipoprotein [Candidatus Levyibacteriota bacterium]
MFKRILVFLGVLLVVSFPAVTLTGCNTVEGAGKDLSHLGGAIQHEARERRQ